MKYIFKSSDMAFRRHIVLLCALNSFSLLFGATSRSYDKELPSFLLRSTVQPETMACTSQLKASTILDIHEYSDGTGLLLAVMHNQTTGHVQAVVYDPHTTTVRQTIDLNEALRRTSKHKNTLDSFIGSFSENGSYLALSTKSGSGNERLFVVYKRKSALGELLAAVLPKELITLIDSYSDSGAFFHHETRKQILPRTLFWMNSRKKISGCSYRPQDRAIITYPQSVVAHGRLKKVDAIGPDAGQHKPIPFSYDGTITDHRVSKNGRFVACAIDKQAHITVFDRLNPDVAIYMAGILPHIISNDGLRGIVLRNDGYTIQERIDKPLRSYDLPQNIYFIDYPDHIYATKHLLFSQAAAVPSPHSYVPLLYRYDTSVASSSESLSDEQTHILGTIMRTKKITPEQIDALGLQRPALIELLISCYGIKKITPKKPKKQIAV